MIPVGSSFLVSTVDLAVTPKPFFSTRPNGFDQHDGNIISVRQTAAGLTSGTSLMLNTTTP
jgi:hypothetical protein